MKKLIFGTTNEAKIKQIRGALAPAGIYVNGVLDKSMLPEVIEDGKTANENARKKAIAYAKVLRKTVFSMDVAVYIDGLSEELQPALNVRRIPNSVGRPSDEDLIKYYSKIIESLGGTATGTSEYGVCIATPNGEFRESTIMIPRKFVVPASPNRQEGYPLSSLVVDSDSNTFMADMNQDEQDLYWQKLVGDKLINFVKSVEF